MSTGKASPHQLPPPLFDARCKACWFVLGLLCLTVASFWTLDLKWAQFFSADAARRMGKFIGEMLVPETSSKFLTKLSWAALETVAMSALGTLLAVVGGLALAMPASKTHNNDPARWRMDDELKATIAQNKYLHANCAIIR